LVDRWHRAVLVVYLGSEDRSGLCPVGHVSRLLS
jgi:hypothetical protein